MGTDGTQVYTPFGGRIQVVSHRIRAFSAVDRGLLAYLAVVGSAAAATVVVLFAIGFRLESPLVVLGLALVAAIAERGSVTLSSTIEGSISLVPTVFAAVLFGPLAAIFVGAASMAGDFRRPYLRWAIYTSTRSFTGAVVGLLAIAVGSVTESDLGSIALATTVGAIAAESLDATFASLTLKLRRDTPLRESLRTLAPVVVTSVALYTPVIALLAFAYSELSPWTLPLFFVPALAAQHLFVLLQRQRGLTEELVGANTRLERASLSFATALVTTLDARDRYTAGHSAAVAIYSRDIARRLGLTPDEQRFAHLAGLVHDIGKVGLPPGLLEKSGPLTLDERRNMEEHCVIGERILGKVDDYAEIAAIVRHHHERVDGRGYPDGLCGHAIPLIARIIAVADAYNAMTSDRPYRDAMPSRVARLRLAQAVEAQFDTSVVAAFEAILATADESYRLASAKEFTFATQSSYETPPISAAA